MKRIALVALATVALSGRAEISTNGEDRSELGGQRRLFNGRDLSGWYTYLKDRGKNVDPKGVFSVRDGVIHVTGEEMGCLTSEEEFSDYRLSLEYRFPGGRQFGGKAEMAPDSGLLFHSTGPDGGFYGIWMESLELNIIKGATGDFWGVGKKGSDRIALSAKVGKELLEGKYAIHDPNGTDTYTIRGNTRVCRSDISRSWRDRKTVDVAANEKPIGAWNRVVLTCVGDRVVAEVNGKVVNRGFAAKPRKGRIQLQSEGCAIEFRDIKIAPADRRVLDAIDPTPLPKWTGADLGQWRPNAEIANLRVEGGVLKGRVTGRDAQLYATLKTPFAPRGNQTFGVRMKFVGAGKCQVFWCRRGDKGFSESRQNKFEVTGDGAWQSTAFCPGWCGREKVTSLRFDLPPEAVGSDFEIAEIAIDVDLSTPELEVDTKRTVGVAFSLQVPKGLHYGQLHWLGDEAGPGELGFTTATDGERHEYWLDLRHAKNLNWGPQRGKPSWAGVVSRFWGDLPFAKTALKLENVRFLERVPETPADPVVTSAYPNEAIPRAGRPFAVEAVVRNFGTRPAKNIRFAFDGLPAGVKPLEPAELSPAEPLPGTDGRETINNFSGPQLVGEWVFRLRLSDLGVGRHRFGLTLAADGVKPRRVEVVADVKPSLGLAKADYPPEPKPISTGKYEIGALLFPGWTIQKWHAVWSHDPIRKPLLGWYDETQPVTLDWQIKHLVENGISFVSVDWYWRDGRRSLTHWQKTFAKARYRKYLKWHLMWDNGFNSAEDQEKLAKHWCETCFNDPQYQTVGGKPIVAICSPQGMESRMAGKGGAKRLVDITQRIAREHGYPGVFFVAMRGMGQDSDEPAFLKQFADYGFDLTTVYGFRGGIPGTVEGAKPRRSFKWMADVSPAHWRALLKNGTLPFWPSLSTGYDDRPWRGERVLEIYGYNAADFRRICEEGRKFADESGVKTFLLGPLDEWGEGSIGFPNREHGFGILEAVRDTFGVKPAEGWPLNYAPEDIGLACPQGNGRD